MRNILCITKYQNFISTLLANYFTKNFSFGDAIQMTIRVRTRTQILAYNDFMRNVTNSEECHFDDSAEMKIEPNLGVNDHTMADQRCLESNQNFVFF